MRNEIEAREYILCTYVPVILALLLLFPLLATVDVILELDAHLPFRRLVPYEHVFE